MSFLLAITIMSFNLRNGQKDDGANSWQYRQEACAAAVMDVCPDFVGFQENTLPQDTFMSYTLKRYAHVAVGRETTNPVTESNAIYYLRSKYHLVQTNTFWLSETPNVCSKGWDGKYPRVATYAVLEHRTTHRQYLVINTHLDHQGVNARRESMQLISDTIAALQQRYPAMPTFLMGDLNVTPDDEALSPTRRTMLSAQETLSVTDITFHGWGKDSTKGKIIDYIFYQNATPTRFEVWHKNYGVPFLSDHYPIVTQFKHK